jgi:zinc transport system permease protein
MTVSFLEALRSNPILLSAIIAGLASSVVSGIIGSYVVVKRIVFISGSISHSVLSGIGFSLWLERAKGYLPSKVLLSLGFYPL